MEKILPKVTLYIAMSLDGYIARENGSIDWLAPYQDKDEDFGHGKFMTDIDTIIMGNRTYQQIIKIGTCNYENQECFVFSRSHPAGKNEFVTFVNDDVVTFINSLPNAESHHIWLVGGSKLIKSFLACDLIHTFTISMMPILLGDGIPLFQGGFAEKKLKLDKVHSYPNDIVQLQYSRK